MKKAMIILLVISLCFTLCACSPFEVISRKIAEIFNTVEDVNPSTTEPTDGSTNPTIGNGENQEDYVLEIMAKHLQLPVGMSGTLPVKYTGSSNIVWMTSNASVAAIDPVGGLITGVKEGSVTISVTDGNKTDTATVKVISVSAPVESSLTVQSFVSLKVGETYILTSEYIGNGTLSWVSDNTSVASIDSNGKITANGEGTTTVKVTDGDKTAKCTVNVTKPAQSTEPTNPPVEKKLSLNKTTLSLKVGENYSLTAYDANGKVGWYSDNTSVATVDSNGKVTAKGEGSAVITANDGKHSVQCVVTVKKNSSTEPTNPPKVNLSISKNSVSLKVGETATITATYSGASGTPTWKIDSGSNVVAISGSGNSITITAKAAGTAYITASYGGKNAQCVVTVTAPTPTVNLSLEKTTISLEVGKTATITATYSGASGKPAWSSTDTSVATVDSNGKVTAKKAGTAYITASYGGKNAQCFVTVTAPTPTVGTLTINTPANTTISVGETLQLDYTYTGNKSDLSFSVFDDEVLSINSSGVITGKAAGTSNVYVNFGSTRLGSVRIKVVEKSGGNTAPAAEKIVVDGTSAPWQCVAGNYMTLTAHAKTSGDPQTVTVTSSNTSVATVSHQSTSGSNWCTFKISCHGGGHTTITITSKDGKATASYSLSVASGYSCNPGSGQLTPEQFVSAVNGVMKENGATISTGAGYRVITLATSELTWSKARSIGESHMREFWGNGKTRMGLSYQGTNEDGNHVFHIHA